MERGRIGILGHKHFMRDLPRDLRPAVHACIRRLTSIDRLRWHAAGVRVKKLDGFAWPVFEARLNDGDRLIFTFNRALAASNDASLHLVLWFAGHHDDAVRNAGRRMGLQNVVAEDLCELGGDTSALGLSWEGIGRIGGWQILGGAPVLDAEAYVEVFDQENREQLNGTGSLVEVSGEDIDRWAESQIDPLLHLTPRQRELTRAGQDNAVFLRGGVGTGKTTVLLYRMLKLLMNGSISRPVFLTYSKSLAMWCRSVFQRLPGCRDLQVEFTSLSGLLKSLQPGLEPVRGKPLFLGVWQQRRLPGNPESAWRELRRLRGGSAFRGHQPRTGADLPPDTDGNLAAAYTEYRKRLGRGLDVMDLVWEAYDHFLSPKVSRELPFDAVFIDEAQDLTPVEWLVCILVGDRPGLAFFCADEAQDVRDTRFTWSGVQAAMKLIGHRAPRFSIVELHGNERNSSPIAAFLRKMSNHLGLQTDPDCPGARPGPAPMTCATSREEAEKIARQKGCPVFLDLGASSSTHRADELFWCLDLDGVKGLEFQVVPVWLPETAWPADKREARRLYTALSRAMQVLLIFTEPALAPKLEELGTSLVRETEVNRVLDQHRDLLALDREAAARWKEPQYKQAVHWVEQGTCTWSDLRSQMPRWASLVALKQARCWVEEGLCSWEVFGSRIPEWVNAATPALALEWVREGLCSPQLFRARIPSWVSTATLEEAIAWVDAGLCTWMDFRFRLAAWEASATLALAVTWVRAGVRTWKDFRSRLSAWMPEANLALASQWVAGGFCTWPQFKDRIASWRDAATLQTADDWVRLGMSSWDDFRSRIPAWVASATLEQAAAWIALGLCSWGQFQGRIRDWTAVASLQMASEWVARGMCSWSAFDKRIPSWLPESSYDQSIEWARSGLCQPAALRDRVGEWAPSLTLQQASELVQLGCCRWGTLAARLPDWDSCATFEQASWWVAGGLRTWKDYAQRIPEWTSAATLEQASDWVRLGLCEWNVFGTGIALWKGSATLDLATQWVECGLASWSDFELKLASWAGQASVRQVTQWRELGLISRQVARSRIKK